MYQLIYSGASFRSFSDIIAETFSYEEGLGD